MIISEDKIKRLCRVRQTLMQMLKERGYLVGNFEISMTKDDLISKFGENMNREDLCFVKARVTNISDQIYVFFLGKDKTGTASIRELMNCVINEKVPRAIFILQAHLTPHAMKHIDSRPEELKVELFMAVTIGCFKSFDFSLSLERQLKELFICRCHLMLEEKVENAVGLYANTYGNVKLVEETEMLANVKEHVLVPAHQVLTPEEKKILLERYNLKESQLPRIQASDPIASYYGMTRGQVVKIIRHSETAGQYVTYRFCI